MFPMNLCIIWVGSSMEEIIIELCWVYLHQTRCTQCSEFTRRIRKSTLQHERDQLEHAQSEHIRNVRHYRSAQSRLNTMSEISTAGGQGGSSASILKLDIDGLDQSKTRYPRLNSINPKSLSGVWRPQIHVLGCIVWGVS